MDCCGDGNAVTPEPSGNLLRPSNSRICSRQYHPRRRRRTVCMREMLNGTLCMNRIGCSSRGLPRDFPPWGMVHCYYRRFRRDGRGARIHNRLRENTRVASGQKTTPSVGIMRLTDPQDGEMKCPTPQSKKKCLYCRQGCGYSRGA